MQKRGDTQGEMVKKNSMEGIVITRQKKNSASERREESMLFRNKDQDKLDLPFLRVQMQSLLQQIASLRKILKDHAKVNQSQSEELRHLRSVNEGLESVDRRLAYTRKKYQKRMEQMEESKRIERASDAETINALRAEVANLKTQLDDFSKVVKQKDVEIAELNKQYSKSLIPNSKVLVNEVSDLNAANENHISQLQKNQSSLLQKNIDMAAEISKLRLEMSHMKTLLASEQDCRKTGQEQMITDLQLARSSLFQRSDILSKEVAQLKNKIDSSILAKAETRSLKSTTFNLRNPDTLEGNLDELSVETIHDVEGLRRAISKLAPSSYGPSSSNRNALNLEVENARKEPEVSAKPLQLQPAALGPLVTPHSMPSTKEKSDGDWGETWKKSLVGIDGFNASNKSGIYSGASSFFSNEEEESGSQHSLFLIPEEINTNDSDAS